jgi:predicted ester cyclase
MTVEANAALVRRFVDQLRNGWTATLMEEFYAADYQRHLNPNAAPLTPDGQRQRGARFREAFPDAYATLEDVVAERDRVAFRMTIRGTHQGQFQGIAPTGRKVDVSFLGVVRIRDKKFVEEWGGLDLFDLLEQLGRTSTVTEV